MALAYTGGDGLFTHLGKIVKHWNLYDADIATIEAARDEIMATILAGTVGDMNSVMSGFQKTADGWRAQQTSRKSQLVALATKRLQDQVSVLNEIESTNEIRQILERLSIQMTADGEDVDRSTVTLTVAAAPGTNVGNGTMLASKVMDAKTAPGSSYPAFQGYLGRDCEMALSQDTRLICTSDSYGDFQPEGGESFLWERTGPYSGIIGAVPCMNAAPYNLLTNGDMETFTVTDIPDGWTIFAGGTGTHVNEEAGGGNFYHGLKSLKINGDGAIANVEVRQALSSVSVQAGKSYACSFKLKGDAAIAAGTLTVQLEGTGWTPGASQRVQIAAASIPTSWTIEGFFTQIPMNVPSDLRLVIRWNGTPTTGKNLYLDDFALTPAIWGDGFAVAVVRGSTPWVKGDHRKVTAANNDAGAWSKWFRDAYGFQIPTDATGSILDSLAA